MKEKNRARDAKREKVGGGFRSWRQTKKYIEVALKYYYYYNKENRIDLQTMFVCVCVRALFVY